ncbi:MAG TPA: GTPase CgtA [Clostridiales bacterium]|nr:GTPase CgtA [Clostridiales bacterium]
MFIDSAKIFIQSGDGGNGAVSFRREKYIPDGGPDGGDGGRGGDIIFRASDSLNTLLNFRYKRKFVAQNGENGQKANRSGKSATHIVVEVPVGTVLKDIENDKIIADLDENGQELIVLKGGRGGKGNRHYATSTRQIPNFAQSGVKGDSMWIRLELKLLGDVGLVGYPNVGKSTILSKVSKARPKIADYEFTTLSPQLGVVSLGEGMQFVLADIPGLIEGAHEGAGLGHQFLRHIERTRLIIHVVDISGYGKEEPIDAYHKINAELSEYSKVLGEKPQIIAANKCDVLEDMELIQHFVKELESTGNKVFPISATTGEGLRELMFYAATLLKDIPKPALYDRTEEEVLFTVDKDKGYDVRKENDIFVVEGKRAERILQSTNLSDFESMGYFQKTIRRIGIIDALEDLGVEEGDTVRFVDFEFEYRR